MPAATTKIPAAAAPTVEPTRDRILSVATRMFAQEGYDAVGMRAIADAAGVRIASLYNHFPSKARILYAILSNVMRAFVDSHIGLLDGGGSRSERLARLFREHILFFWEHREAVGVMLREERGLDASDREEVNGLGHVYQDRIRDFIAAGVEEGEFEVRNVRVATLAILDMINGIVVRDWFKPGQPLSIDQLAQLYADLAVRNVLRGDAVSRSRSQPTARKRSRKEKDA